MKFFFRASSTHCSLEVGVGATISKFSPSSSILKTSLPINAFNASLAENKLPSDRILEALLKSYANCASWTPVIADSPTSNLCFAWSSCCFIAFSSEIAAFKLSIALKTPKYNSAVLTNRFCCSYAKSASAAFVNDFDCL